MQEKKLNEQGQKDFQRTGDLEDRSLVYRNWIRTIRTDGMFIDIDFIKWRYTDGTPTPVAITDITRCDSETVSEKYLDAITNRLFVRDKQGQFLEKLGELLKIPVYLVLFQKDLLWIYAYSFRKRAWRKFTKESWETHLRTL